LATTDKEALEKYISGLEKSFPADYMPGLIRHLVAVQLGDGEAADAAADAVTEAFPGDPDVIRSLVSTWLSANDPESGFRYLERSIAKAPPDDAMAALYFYKALLASEVAMAPEDLTKALANLATAEEYFKKSYPEGHEIFAMIEEIRVQWNESINPPQTEESAAAAESAPAAENTPTVESPPAQESTAPVQGNSVDQ
jgi:predicted Zn-dependent protease